MRERRWRTAAAGIVLGVLASLGAVSPLSPARAQDGSDLVEACEPATAVPEVGPRACKSVEAGTWLTAQGCRRVAPLQEPVCPTVDGRPVHESEMAAFEASWLNRALSLQRQLDLDVPLAQSLLPHTHNSANSAAYAPSVSNLDANQVLSLTDQLRLGMRAIEIDVHWVPHPSGDPAQGSRAVVQCHGEPVATPAGVLHAGCSVDTLLVDLLTEVRQWLDANPDEVVLLYLENALDGDPAAHAAAVAAIDTTLGELVARPKPDAGCQSLPVMHSRAKLLRDGARVLITGNCGPGGWNDRVFDRYPRWDESGGSTFDCASARSRSKPPFDTILVRRYEDSTWLSAMVGSGSHLDAATLTKMVRCGVNLVGFDQLHPGDDRLASLVWSWRIDEPAADAGSCAALGGDGRFFADDCAVPRQVACRTSDDDWAVTAEAVAWSGGEVACQAAGHAGAGVPANGWDSAALRAAADLAGASEVWLAYAQDSSDTWVPGLGTSEQAPATPASDRSSRAATQSLEVGGTSTSDGDAGDGTPIAASRPLPLGAAAPVAAALAASAIGLLARTRQRRRRQHPG